MILVYVTCKDLEEAKKISKVLLEKRLAACTNFFPVSSMYWWDKSMNLDSEFALVLKTVKEKFREIEKEIKKVHSYECPCIVSLNVDEASKDFLEWVKKEIKD